MNVKRNYILIPGVKNSPRPIKGKSHGIQASKDLSSLKNGRKELVKLVKVIRTKNGKGLVLDITLSIVGLIGGMEKLINVRTWNVNILILNGFTGQI